MPIATFRGERSVAEIADNLFNRLTPRQRKKAEAAILEANPQLRDIRTLREGAILHVPALPELRAKASRSLENPEAQIAENLADTLSAFSKRIAEHVNVEQENTRAQSKLLKTTKFKKEISKAPNLQALAVEATKALDTRSKALGERQKRVQEAISQARKDLEARLG